MAVEIKNAMIENVRIFVEDHGILTSFLTLNYGGGSVQGFGGYDLREKMSPWLLNLFRVFGVDDLVSLKGMPCRAEADWGKVYRIGHFTEDRWFNPSEMWA